MRKTLLMLLLAVLVFGCTSAQRIRFSEQRLRASFYTDKVFHPGNPKVLVFSGNPQHTGEITDISWRRLCDVVDCSMSGPAKGAGSVAPAPRSCYIRWWKECDGKNCGSNWWEKCTKAEAAREPK